MRRMYSKKQIEAIAEVIAKLTASENIKYGTYIYDNGDNFKWVDEIPSNFTGVSIFLGDDGIYITSYVGGHVSSETIVSTNGVSISEGSSFANYNSDGADKLNFAQLTHSLAELDETLRQIVVDALADGWNNGVACTQAQWNTIKALLDKSLYFNYEGVSMIKTYTDGSTDYGFGDTNSDSGYTLVFYYNKEHNLLNAKYVEN